LEVTGTLEATELLESTGTSETTGTFGSYWNLRKATELLELLELQKKK